MLAEVVFLALCGTVLSSERLSQIAEAVELRLVSDRGTYYVGEPVRLTLTIENRSETPVFGYLWLQPYLPKNLRSSALLYCRGDDACVEFLGRIPNVELIELNVSPRPLAPGSQEQSRFAAALNPENQHLVLDVPGDYEFRWVTWGIHECDGVSTRVRGKELGASAFVRVLPVPKEEHEAFEYYSKNQLGELAQFDRAYSKERPEWRVTARTMLERYPNSIYAAAIHGGFLDVLEIAALQGRVTPEERGLLADLRSRHSER